jgi:hypothetical protein
MRLPTVDRSMQVLFALRTREYNENSELNGLVSKEFRFSLSVVWYYLDSLAILLPNMHVLLTYT